MALWALWSRERTRRALAVAEAALAKTKRDLATVAGELDQAFAAAARSDSTITYLKGEIDALEKNLDTCSGPGDVRDRIRRMLQGTPG